MNSLPRNPLFEFLVFGFKIPGSDGTGAIQVSPKLKENSHSEAKPAWHENMSWKQPLVDDSLDLRGVCGAGGGGF